MPLKTDRDDIPSLNLTPMIDIVFLLIIFFMVGTKFTELERKLQLQVPEVSDLGTLTSAPEKKVVNIYRDGSMSLDGEFLTPAELKLRLAEARSQYAELGVLVRGDAEVPLQRVTDALAACRQAGILEMGISVRLGQQTR